MKKVVTACVVGLMVPCAAGYAAAQQTSAGLTAGVDPGPIVAALLALVLIASGGRRRLRM